MNRENIQKVLIVRFSSIGDIVLTSPIVRCIKSQLKCEVHFLTKTRFRSVVEHSPQIDKLYTIDKEITEILPALKGEGYDLIVDLHKNLRTKRLILSLGIKSIDFDKINFKKWLRVHTRVNVLPKKHLVDRYFDGVAPLGVTNDGKGLRYHHGLTESEVATLIPTDRYMTIVLGATYYTKRIPKDKIELLIKNTQLKVVLLGGNDVKTLAEELAITHPNVVNQAGKCSLNESAALVQNSVYCATGDTGLMHVAAAYKVPTMVFWGSTAYELGMYPYYGASHPTPCVHLINQNISCSPCSKIGKKTCPKKHFKCMLDITEGMIVRGIEELEGSLS